jgi:putative SOS response-associated peptidase YedK
MFRRVFKYRRCLVAADGFYEWKEANGKKLPWYICRKDRKPFFFAGLWDQWGTAGTAEAVESYTILTMEANSLVATIHERQPVILQEQNYSAWLSQNVTDPKAILEAAASLPAEELTAYRVSTAVNRATNEGPNLIEPVEEQ